MIKEPREQRAKALWQPHYIMRRKKNEVLRFYCYEPMGDILFLRGYQQRIYSRLN